MGYNLKSAQERVFLRRPRFIVPFPFHEANQRAQIWRRGYSKSTPTQGLDAQKLAQLNVAGGISAILPSHAAFLAGDAGEVVLRKYLLQATKSEYVK